MQQFDVMKQFRHNLLILMRARGMSQRQLSQATGIGQPGVCRILAGKEHVTLERAQRIADAFELTLPELLSENLEKILAIPA